MAHSMQHTTIYDEIYSRFRRSINIAYALGWIVITVIEIIVGMIMCENGTVNGTFEQYMGLYVIMPAVGDAAAICVTFLAMRSSRLSNNLKNYIVVAMMLVIATMLSVVHNYFLVMCASFIIPIFLTIAFNNQRLARITTLASISCLFLTLPLIHLLEGDRLPDMRMNYLNAAVTCILIVVSYLITALIISLHAEREKRLIRVEDENDRLNHRVLFDSLTDLKNHSSFYSDLESGVQTYQETGRPFTVCMIDIDNFKKINDENGHHKGDEILRSVSNVLHAISTDYGEAYRYGGDEFAVIFHCTLQESIDLVDQMQEQIRTTQYDLENGRKVSISAGIFEVRDKEINSEQAFYLADQALYQAKFNGKDRYVVTEENK